MNADQAARRWQERRTAQSRRDVELETFPTTGGAAAKNAHPMFGQHNQPRTRTRTAATDTGEVCSVKATSVAVSTTPTVVEFTTAVGEQAWADDLGLPTDSIVPNFTDAYYDIQVEIDRGAFSGTVQVEVLRGNTVVWGPTQSPYWTNPAVPVTAKGRLTREAT